jgi:hypothetical protein
VPQAARPALLRRALPWVVSAGLLVYVFGWLTDWQTLTASIGRANVPLFVAVTFADKMLFFLLWTTLQVTAIRRLVGPLSVRSLLALRGGSELLRTISNPLADGAFLVGLIQVTGGSTGRVILAASVPGLVHGIVLVFQISLALFLLEGGIAGNRDVAITAAVGWGLILGTAFAVRRARHSASGRLARVRATLEAIDFRAFAPMLGWFLVLAFLGISVQWIATHAFGAPIPFLSLMARIPILYAAFLIPSFGNFGTRELAWAGLFGEYHDRDILIAYAFATNTLFLMFHVLIGALFLPRAISLIQQVRKAQREGEAMPKGPLVHDPGEP